MQIGGGGVPSEAINFTPWPLTKWSKIKILIEPKSDWANKTQSNPPFNRTSQWSIRVKKREFVSGLLGNTFDFDNFDNSAAGFPGAGPVQSGISIYKLSRAFHHAFEYVIADHPSKI